MTKVELTMIVTTIVFLYFLRPLLRKYEKQTKGTVFRDVYQDLRGKTEKEVQSQTFLDVVLQMFPPRGPTTWGYVLDVF